MTRRMSLRHLAREMLAAVSDLGIVLFCLFVSVLLAFGLRLLDWTFTLIPGVILCVFSSAALMKYGTRVARAKAMGLEVPSADGSVFDYADDWWAFTPWLGMVATGGVALLINDIFGQTQALVFSGFAVLLLPAIFCVIVVTQRFWHALHFPGLLRIVKILGLDYLKLLLLWAAMVAACGALIINGGLASWLGVLLLCFALMIVFRVSGEMLFFHHQALGIPIERDTREARNANALEAKQLVARRGAINHAYTYISRGSAAAGLRRVREYLQQEETSHDAWRWFIEQMKSWESEQAMLMLSRDYISELREHGADAEARKVFLYAQYVSARFKPHAIDEDYVCELFGQGQC